MKKKILWTIAIVLGLFVLVNGITSVEEFTQKVPLSKCIDYQYFMEFPEEALPVNLAIYTLEPDGTEEVFKTDYATTAHFDTILHCGHDYKIVYEFNGYEKFIDYVSIPEVNPLIRKTTKIEVPPYG